MTEKRKRKNDDPAPQLPVYVSEFILFMIFVLVVVIIALALLQPRIDAIFSN